MHADDLAERFHRRKVLSPLRYPGGKRRLVPFIAAALAENDLRPDVFVEPYAGGASVSLELLDLGLVQRVVLGDRDPYIVAFWETVKNDVDWLCRRVETVPLDLATWERMKRGRFRSRRSMALACLYLNRTSFNGALHWRAGPIGGKAQAGDYDIGCRFPRARLVDRLRACAQIATRIAIAPAQDAMTTVRTAREEARRSGKSVFYYLDPPFWAKSGFLYRRTFTELDHEHLAESLHWLRDHFLLSYDAAPEIAELYTGHSAATVAEIELLYAGSGSAAGTELVISNLPSLPSETRLWRTSKEWKDVRQSVRSASMCTELP
ncbi:MAG TPA: DNA adenine methylase [Conexibacter sp.]|nr:DNA adenine methylase [Conexibacter sp.]